MLEELLAEIRLGVDRYLASGDRTEMARVETAWETLRSLGLDSAADEVLQRESEAEFREAFSAMGIPWAS